MQANKITLGEILSPDGRLVAPLFQRPYVWNEDENWQPLWQALHEVFDRRLDGHVVRPYFLGALVLNQMATPVGSVPTREIIDGQQRMTTLQIFIQVAKERCKASGIEFPARALGRLTRNEIDKDTEEVYKVWPTNVDRAAFRAVMAGTSGESRMHEARAYFETKLAEWLKAGEVTTRDRADAMVAALKQDLVFVAINLDNDDDGQLIFETLNSLGTPLLPSDLVKNLLFRAAIDEDLDTNLLYDAHWQMFEADAAYWREVVTIGRRQRTRLDMFLQYYLTYKLRREPIQAHLFREYRDAHLDGLFGSTTKALSDFAAHARLFQEFDQAAHGDAAGSLRHVLNLLDASVPNPLVLGIYANVPAGTERDAMLASIESYLIRRFLCAYTTKAYNRIVAEVLSNLSKTEWSLDNLRANLLSYDGTTNGWPTDEEVSKRLREKNTYGDIRGVGIAFVLSRVENAMRGDKSEKHWNTRSPMTIEHIMPRQWKEHWRLASETPERVEQREARVNRIGNLTILTQKLNTSISNGPWVNKRTQLNAHTVLLMNSELAALEDWDEQQIDARTERLIGHILLAWPRG